MRLSGPNSARSRIRSWQVLTALHEDPYFPDMRVVITIDHGVVHLVGFVYDADDMIAAKRIIRRKVPGAKVS
jgi:hypothetical protein